MGEHNMFKRFFLLAVSFFLMTSINTINANDHNAGDPAKGKKVFKKCAACHSIAEGAKHKTGPNLWNIYGNKAAAAEGYKYSNWLKGSGIEWNDENLAAWISPKKVKNEKFGKEVKKSKMIFSGLRKPAQIEDVIAYIKTLK